MYGTYEHLPEICQAHGPHGHDRGHGPPDRGADRGADRGGDKGDRGERGGRNYKKLGDPETGEFWRFNIDDPCMEDLPIHLPQKWFKCR